MDGCRDREGVRFWLSDTLFWREGVRGIDGTILGVVTLESIGTSFVGKDEGGKEILRLADMDRLGAAGVLVATLFLLLGTMVVTPLVVLLNETMEYVRGFSPLDDVPAVVERDVDLDTRDGVSDGGFGGIERKD